MMIDMKLKQGWKTAKFGDVVHLNPERIADPEAEGVERFIGLEHIIPEDLHIRTWGLVADSTTFTNYFKPGQVLFGKRRAYQRKVAVAEFDGVCSGDIYVFEPKDPNVLLPELLPFICQTEGFYENAVETSAGSLSPRTNWKHLEKYEFALPPLEKQRQIAEIIWGAENVMRSYQKSYASNTKLIISSLETQLDPKAQGWETRKIGNLFEVVSGGTPRRNRAEYWNGTIPWIKTGEVNYSLITQTEEKITLEGLNNSSAKLIPKNSVVMALFGQGPTLGRVGLSGIEATTNQACANIMPNGEMNMKFLFYFLWRQYERIRLLARGAAQPNLNASMVKALKVPVIAKNEQDYWVSYIDNIVEARDDIQNRMSDAGLMKASLLATFLGR